MNNTTCMGCVEQQPAQLAHMGYGGCLIESEGSETEGESTGTDNYDDSTETESETTETESEEIEDVLNTILLQSNNNMKRYLNQYRN